MDKRIFFYDDNDLKAKQGLRLTYGSVEKKGTVNLPKPAWDFAECSLKAFVRLPGGGYRAYYNGTVHESGLAVAESEDGIHWEKPVLDQVKKNGEYTNRLKLGGLPENSILTSPQVIRRANGDWYLWCWLHANDEGYFRFVCFKSADGLHWENQGIENPILLHPADRELGQNAWVAGLTMASTEDRFAHLRKLAFNEAKSLRTNDSCSVHYNEERDLFEYYGVWLLPVDPASCRVTPHDNAPMVLRTLQRRESRDGLHWTEPELILTPDENDPLHQQFYYLNVHKEPGWYIGFMGNYRCWEQTHDIELIFSRDGHHWERPLRGGFFKRGTEGETDTMAAYAADTLIDLGGKWRLYYRGVNVPHNLMWKYPNGSVTESGLVSHFETMAAEFTKGRFAGLRAEGNVTGTLIVRDFIHTAPEITVDADVRGALKAELRDLYGRPLPGYELNSCETVRGDSGRHLLRWNGKTSKGYRYDAVSLRIELEEGTLYSVER